MAGGFSRLPAQGITRSQSEREIESGSGEIRRRRHEEKSKAFPFPSHMQLPPSGIPRRRPRRPRMDLVSLRSDPESRNQAFATERVADCCVLPVSGQRTMRTESWATSSEPLGRESRISPSCPPTEASSPVSWGGSHGQGCGWWCEVEYDDYFVALLPALSPEVGGGWIVSALSPAVAFHRANDEPQKHHSSHHTSHQLFQQRCSCIDNCALMTALSISQCHAKSRWEPAL